MMVGRYDESRLLLVSQVDHSRVAGLLAAHWGNDAFAPPTPYVSMVLAAQEHDSGWWEWESKPTLNEAGYPPDYIGSIRHLGRGVWLDLYRHGIQRVAEQDPYAGYMVSMHGDGLLTQGMGLLPSMPKYTDDPAVVAFLAEQKALRAGLQARLQADGLDRELLTEEHIWTNFKLMEVFDQFAQFICNRYPFNSRERKNGPTNTLSETPAPVRAGQDDIVLTVDVQDETRAIVRPYPFGVDPLVVSFQGRLVPNQAYVSQDQFLHTFYTAERVNVTYTLHAA
jgi:hypothetical protein